MSDKAKSIMMLCILTGYLAFQAAFMVYYLLQGEIIPGLLALLFVVGMTAWAFYAIGSAFGGDRAR